MGLRPMQQARPEQAGKEAESFEIGEIGIFCDDAIRAGYRTLLHNK